MTIKNKKQGECGLFCFKYWLGKGCDDCISLQHCYSMTIKKISILVATLLLSANIYCQELFHNSLAVMMQLDSYSWGARYERRGDRMGGYIYGITGDFYRSPSGIKDETSIGAGMIFLPKYWEYPYAPAITMGFNYAKYTYYESLLPFEDTPADIPFSFEMGLSAQHGRVNFGFNSDLVKWKFMLFAGINF